MTADGGVEGVEVGASEEVGAAPGERDDLAAAIDDIVARFSRLEVLDSREPDEILGYDEHGLPT